MAVTAPPLAAQAPPEPVFVLASDGVPLAAYDEGDPEAPPVLAVHGFASSAWANWYQTGWIRELTRAGFRVIAIDQRGHGRSGKPHDPAAYSMQQLVRDVHTVLDAYLLDEIGVIGYSLGARVAWHASLGSAHRISRAVLGGIPDGQPLRRFRVDQARAFLENGTPVEDTVTGAYLQLVGRSAGNDLAALIGLVEGVRQGLQPDPDQPPTQPVLFATGSEDAILPASHRLAEATPTGTFLEIPGRNHFNAPTSRVFRDAATAFLTATDRRSLERADEHLTLWEAGLAALRFVEPDTPTAVLQERLRGRWTAWLRATDAPSGRSN